MNFVGNCLAMMFDNIANRGMTVESRIAFESRVDTTACIAVGGRGAVGFYVGILCPMFWTNPIQTSLSC